MATINLGDWIKMEFLTKDLPDKFYRVYEVDNKYAYTSARIFHRKFEDILKIKNEKLPTIGINFVYMGTKVTIP